MNSLFTSDFFVLGNLFLLNQVKFLFIRNLTLSFKFRKYFRTFNWVPAQCKAVERIGL
jgi:hypothetical protein